MNDKAEPRGGNEIVREQLGAETQQQNELAAQAIAAAARADIESRFILAQKFPRDIDKVREALLKECRRKGFAESAIYRKPIGNVKNPRTGQWEAGFVDGLSIRFAEAAIRCMRNVYVSVTVIWDDAARTVQRITVMDLESVTTIAVDVTVSKQVERSRLKSDQEFIEKRRNASGNIVFVVAANDDQVLNKVNALVSKTLRNGMLRLLPGDISDECEALCRKTMADKDAADPDAARRAIFDSFATVGVGVEKIKAFLGHGAETLQPKELAQLRALFAAIRDGETTWESVVGEPAPDAPQDGQKPATQAKLDDLVNRRRAGTDKPATAPASPAPAAEPAKSDPPAEPKTEAGAAAVPPPDSGPPLTESEQLAKEAGEFDAAEAAAAKAERRG